MKPPKFLICKNELVKPVQTFLLHTQNPRFLAEICTFESKEMALKWRSNLSEQAPHILGGETLVNGLVIVFYIVEFIDVPDPSDLPQPGRVISGGLLSRTGDWLHAYFKETLKNK